MIRERRQVHRRIFSLLVVFVPALLIAGLLARREMPPAFQLDERLTNAAGLTISSATAPSRVTADSYEFEVSVDDSSAAGPVVTIRASTPVLKPDVLVYWTASDEGEGLPADAILAGALSKDVSQKLTLPAEAAGGARFDPRLQPSSPRSFGADSHDPVRWRPARSGGVITWATPTPPFNGTARSCSTTGFF